jgi:hypothetical protein
MHGYMRPRYTWLHEHMCVLYTGVCLCEQSWAKVDCLCVSTNTRSRSIYLIIEIKDNPASNLVRDDHGCLQPQLPGITPQNSEPHYMQNAPRPHTLVHTESPQNEVSTERLENTTVNLAISVRWRHFFFKKRLFFGQRAV